MAKFFLANTLVEVIGVGKSHSYGITPMLILGVPITDTVYAMIRRKFNKQKISSADKMHLHHRLLSLGFTHRGTVLTIYALAMVFSFIALLMNYASNTAIILLIISTGFGIELFIELIGLVGENRQPLMCGKGVQQVR